VRAAFDRPRLWRFTAALSALLLCGLVLVCTQGSLTIVSYKPVGDRQYAAAPPSWERWCTWGIPRKRRKRLAFCARVEGRVFASTHGPNPSEVHLALISDFHIVLVRLLSNRNASDRNTIPKRGSNVVAIGPLFRARDGQREVQAFWYQSP
jgi:hypothetical protein